ncbi:OmpA family protein [Marinobacter changyiensis]|uniref:OmpA family protein n=1 Tax=Marinobacter changyiensis TaxID=2604091 RepID=UPI001FE27AB4|nr:OmpA family protein [Marinobacter changyiensis]
MSQSRHRNRIQSLQPIWLTVCGSALLATLAGCSSTAEQPQDALQPMATSGSNTTPPKPTEGTTIDQSPIVVAAASDNSSAQQSDSLKTSNKDTDMTVLVMDDPELIAKSAALEAGMVMPVNTTDDTPRRPHRTRFHYSFDKHDLNDEDQDLLRKHAAYLRAHPEVTVHIHAHTDQFGADDYNIFLAKLRASAAAKLLKAEGVNDAQIRTTGWGSSKPLTKPEDHAANRRLELEYHTGHMAKAQ